MKLYEDFAKSRAKKELNSSVENVSIATEDGVGKKKNVSHIFQVSVLKEVTLVVIIVVDDGDIVLVFVIFANRIAGL